jgi:hypothetical protein
VKVGISVLASTRSQNLESVQARRAEPVNLSANADTSFELAQADDTPNLPVSDRIQASCSGTDARNS